MNLRHTWAKEVPNDPNLFGCEIARPQAQVTTQNRKEKNTYLVHDARIGFRQRDVDVQPYKNHTAYNTQEDAPGQ